MKTIQLYREDDGQYSTSEAQQDDVSGVYVQKTDYDELKAKLSSHERMAASGFYFTDSELDAAKATWERAAVSKVKPSIQADAIEELIKEKAYSAPVDGIATSIIDADGATQYADKLRAGK